MGLSGDFPFTLLSGDFPLRGGSEAEGYAPQARNFLETGVILAIDNNGKNALWKVATYLIYGKSPRICSMESRHLFDIWKVVTDLIYGKSPLI